MASEAGIDPGYLSNLKKGKRPPPSLPVLRSLAAALGVNDQWLMGVDTMMHAPPRTQDTEDLGDIVYTPRKLPEAIVRSPESGGGSISTLSMIGEIRSEIIHCIHEQLPPSPRLLALIGEIEAVLIETRSQR